MLIISAFSIATIFKLSEAVAAAAREALPGHEDSHQLYNSTVFQSPMVT